MTELLTTVTRKGQVTIPQEAREALGLKPGDRVRFIVEEGGRIAIRRVMSLDEIAGSVAALSPPKTWNEIEQIVADERAEAYGKKHEGKRAQSA